MAGIPRPARHGDEEAEDCRHLSAIEAEQEGLEHSPWDGHVSADHRLQLQRFATQTAFGSMNVTDQGDGQWLATGGSLTVTGGS